MKFTKLIIENFLSIGSAEINLADRGLLLVQGVNKDETSADSNGAGKSSIVDALSWCLFDETARGKSGDAVVNRFVGKNCSVGVTIVEGDDTYVITRHRKHKTNKNALLVSHHPKSGPSVDLTKGTAKLTQAIVEQIIGCSQSVFNGAVYGAQNRFPNLPAMSDKELKLLIEEASGVTVLEKAYEIARRELLTHKTTLDAATTALNGLKARLALSTTQAQELKAAYDKAGVDRTQELLRHNAELGAVMSEIRELDRQIGAFDAAALDALIAAARNNIDGVKGEQEVLDKLTRAAAAAARAYESARATTQARGAALKRTRDEAERLAHQVGCPCTTCARPFTASDIAPAQKLAEEKIAAEVKAIADEVGKVRALERAQDDAAKARDDHRAGMTDVSAWSKRLSELQSDRAALDRLIAQVGAKRTEATRIGARIKETEGRPNPHAETLRNALLRTKALKEEVDTAAQAHSKMDAGTAILEATAAVFGPAGVRARVLDEVTPFLNDQTAKYLGTLSDGNLTATWTTLVKTAKGELREKFSIEVTNATGGDDFEGISGGEQRKVRIACALALQDLVARRAVKPIDLWIGDEIDQALDGAGLERLTTIMEEKARERGTVLVISHNSLSDWIPNVITVTKENKIATVAESA